MTEKKKKEPESAKKEEAHEENSHEHEHADEQSHGAETGERNWKERFEQEFFSGAKVSFESVCGAAKDMERNMEDAFLSSVPPDVTKHLVNSQKELLMAGRRVLDLAMNKLDKAAERSSELHEKKES